ncbi:MAG: glycosyltransferase family 4 protein [Planctomycetota bacterium]
MRVALLTDGFFPFVLGGMQKHSYYLAKYLAQQRVHVDLYYCKQREANLPFTAAELDYISLEQLAFPPNGGYFGHYLVESWLYSKRILDRLRPQLNHTDLIYAQGFAAWELLQQKPQLGRTPPVMVNFHGLEMFQKAATWWERLAQVPFIYPTLKNLRRADFVISLGGKLTDILRRRTRREILEIPIGVEASWLTPDINEVKSRREFLYVGRYERRKGIEELTAALRRLGPQADYRFHFVGPIPEDQRLEDDRVIYHGKIMDEPRLRQIYRDCDVLLCPSYAEGMPTVILEAMASGCAVIATNVGAVAEEVLPGKTGWFVEPGSLTSLQQALRHAMSLDGPSLQVMKTQARQHVMENFLWDHVIQQNLVAFDRAQRRSPVAPLTTAGCSPHEA